MRAHAYKEYPVLRKRCVALREKGYKQRQIAYLLGCSQQWVSDTVKKYGQSGEAIFANRKPPGAPVGLSQDQLVELVAALSQGAEAHGFLGAVWTRKRVGIVIERLFGISYEVSQVGRLLKKVGWRLTIPGQLQKPQRKAIKQKPELLRQWQEEQLPALKKKP